MLRAGEIFAYDVSSESLDSVGKQFGVKTFDDLNKALAIAPDIVFVCTPPTSHIEIATKAVGVGSHVFIEKPISNNLDGIDELIKFSNKTSKKITVGYNLRFHEGMRLVKNILNEGKIGKVICARAEFGYYLPYWRPTQDYRKNFIAKKDGGGIILDGASHEIDYLRWLLGEVSEIYCVSGKLSSLDVESEDTAEIVLKFSSGTIAGLHMDFVRHDYCRNCEIVGEKGTIVWNFAENCVKVYDSETKAWSVVKTDEDANKMYVSEVKEFLECVRSDKEPSVTAADGKRVLELVMAIKKSSECGKAVTV
jgi:predicted dehydrogenase